MMSRREERARKMSKKEEDYDDGVPCKRGLSQASKPSIKVEVEEGLSENNGSSMGTTSGGFNLNGATEIKIERAASVEVVHGFANNPQTETYYNEFIRSFMPPATTTTNSSPLIRMVPEASEDSMQFPWSPPQQENNNYFQQFQRPLLPSTACSEPMTYAVYNHLEDPDPDVKVPLVVPTTTPPSGSDAMNPSIQSQPMASSSSMKPSKLPIVFKPKNASISSNVMIGKRRGGGRALPTGIIKRPNSNSQKPTKTTESKNQVNKKEEKPWSRYMAEVERYKNETCSDDAPNRSLVK